MRILFRLFGLVLTCLFVVHIVSCGQREEDNEVGTIASVSAEPPDGSTINANGIITVTFDGVPSNVSANVGVVKQLGTTVTISGPFHRGTTHANNYVDGWGSNTDLYRRNTYLSND